MKVLIGGAWVYANGPLHIGHIAALLPGDIIARYFRLKGDDVSYVSGSDCHGTPITIRAKKENKSPKEISDYYHNEFVKGFDYLDFSYDYYGKTSSKEHIKFVVDFHEKLYESKYVYEGEEEQGYCPKCEKYLPGRLIEGVCPKCGGIAKGEQCEHCGSLFLPSELEDPWCCDCHGKPVFRDEKHLYLKISGFEEKLKNLINTDDWKDNAVKFTQRYIEEGLRDRAITRDLDWGIHIPKEGYENKKIYIWAENVLGYLSSNKQHCIETNQIFKDYHKDSSEVKHYYIHGKDNIPFHSIILPSLLLAHGGHKHLPDHIISSEYLTLNGSKISTSQNYAIWIKDLIGKYNSDALRYYFITHAPEKRDSDFTLKEFIYCNNGELLGAYGNFINRTLTFVKKRYNNQIPNGHVSLDLKVKIHETFLNVGELISKGNLKEALKSVFDVVRYGNKYFDVKEPWKSVVNDYEESCETLYNCIYLIQNLSLLLEPFLPKSSNVIKEWFRISNRWQSVVPKVGYELPEINILFERLEQE